MLILRNGNTIVGRFRPSRKCFSFDGSSLLLLILIVAIAQLTAERASDSGDLPPNFNIGEQFKNSHNLERHHAKLPNSAPQEKHPIIIYKEDLVSEDYVLPKNETKSEKHKRRYKDIGNQRRHNKRNITDVVIEEKPEKILFDIIPEKPIIVPEDMVKHRKSHMKLVPLINDFSETTESETEEKSSKEKLHKIPKKFNRRVRRNANQEHVIHKRNPYFRHLLKVNGEVPTQVQYYYVKHSVAGKKHNGLDIPIPGPSSPSNSGPNENMPISFANRVAADEDDRVIFSGGKTTARTTKKPMESIFRDPRPENYDFSFMNPKLPTTSTTNRPTTRESIFRDPRPENYDFSFMNPQRPTATTQAPIVTARPETRRPTTRESIFRDPRPENYDFSFMNKGKTQATTTRSPTTAAQPVAETGISNCVWAIVHCCSRNSLEIRYSCFEQNGCYGAFWDINPCAEHALDRVVNYVNDYYS